LSRARVTPPSPEDEEKRVKIAILDTGIDLTHPLIKKYVDTGHIPKTYDFVEGTSSITDLHGHGTHTAHLLLKTAPNASIYVARVFRTTKADRNTAQLVAKVSLF
jgi:subtilisin family serine protease